MSGERLRVVTPVCAISPLALQLQGYPFNRIIFNAVISRVGQVVAGESKPDEAYKRIEELAELDACDSYIVLVTDPETRESDAHGPYPGPIAVCIAEKARMSRAES